MVEGALPIESLNKSELEVALLRLQVQNAELERQRNQLELNRKQSFFSGILANAAFFTVLIAVGTSAVTWFVSQRQLKLEKERTAQQITLEEKKAEHANIAAALFFSSSSDYACEAARRLHVAKVAGIFSAERALTVDGAIMKLRPYAQANCPGLDPRN